MKTERPKMPASQRAKQFAPFAAITNLEAALRAKEEEHRQMVEAEVEKLEHPEINK